MWYEMFLDWLTDYANKKNYSYLQMKLKISPAIGEKFSNSLFYGKMDLINDTLQSLITFIKLLWVDFHLFYRMTCRRRQEIGLILCDNLWNQSFQLS